MSDIEPLFNGRRIKAKETSALPLSRLEITIAEILRQNAPISYSDLDGMLWLDLVNDFAGMLTTGKPRFGIDAFYAHCFDGDETNVTRSGI